LPPVGLDDAVISTVKDHVRRIAEALNVVGLINVQFAVHEGEVYVIEANPRASRTVPFVAKATGVELVKVATRVMLGSTLAELREEGVLVAPVGGDHVSVKEAMLPFNRFPDVDTALGPEMRSTGEVMGIDRSFGRAFLKAQTAVYTDLPASGTAFLSLNDADKQHGVTVARGLRRLGIRIVATSGTADHLRSAGLEVDGVVSKVSERSESDFDDAVGLIERGEIDFVINTPRGKGTHRDGEAIRKAANIHRVSAVTTIKAALAAIQGMLERAEEPLGVKSLQEYHER
jgi:carbamoyl-phosphate synthase large subunit